MRCDDSQVGASAAARVSDWLRSDVRNVYDHKNRLADQIVGAVEFHRDLDLRESGKCTEGEQEEDVGRAGHNRSVALAGTRLC